MKWQDDVDYRERNVASTRRVRTERGADPSLKATRSPAAAQRRVTGISSTHMPDRGAAVAKTPVRRELKDPPSRPNGLTTARVGQRAMAKPGSKPEAKPGARSEAKSVAVAGETAEQRAQRERIARLRVTDPDLWSALYADDDEM